MGFKFIPKLYVVNFEEGHELGPSSENPEGLVVKVNAEIPTETALAFMGMVESEESIGDLIREFGDTFMESWNLDDAPGDWERDDEGHILSNGRNLMKLPYEATSEIMAKVMDKITKANRPLSNAASGISTASENGSKPETTPSLPEPSYPTLET